LDRPCYACGSCTVQIETVSICRADGLGRGVELRRPRERVVKATTSPLIQISLNRSRWHTSSPRRKQPRVSTAAAKLRTWWSPPKLPLTHFRKSRSPSPPGMCGAASSASHVHLHPHRGSSPAECPEDLYSVCGRIWQHALGGRSGVKPRASPAGMRGRELEQEQFLNQLGVDILCRK
jgi:hypothetical protein